MRTTRAEIWTGRAVLWLLVLFTLAPFIGMLSAALQPAGTTPTGFAVPDVRNVGNFGTASQIAHVPQLMWSSLLLVLMTVPAAIAFASFAAYGIEVLRAPLGGAVMLLLIAGLTLPFEGIITPLYFQMREWGLLNTRLAIALPLIALYMPFGVYWMRTHFLKVPREITEAASMDGATGWQALWHIHLPLARPALSALTVLFTLWTWNQFIIAFVMVEDPLKRTVAGALGAFRGQYGQDIVLMSAGALLIMLPTIVVFALFQKQFTAALLQGSVKG